MTQKIAVKKYYSFQGLYLSLVEKTGVLPPDTIGNAIATFFGWSRSIASQTRKDLEEKGYVFTKNVGGWYEVELSPLPEPIPLAPVGIPTSNKDELTIEEIDTLLQEDLKQRLTPEQRSAVNLLIAMLLRMGQ